MQSVQRCSHQRRQKDDSVEQLGRCKSGDLLAYGTSTFAASPQPGHKPRVHSATRSSLPWLAKLYDSIEPLSGCQSEDLLAYGTSTLVASAQLGHKPRVCSAGTTRTARSNILVLPWLAKLYDSMKLGGKAEMSYKPGLRFPLPQLRNKA